MSEKRIICVGGGSGGHFYPLMAVVAELKNHAAHAGLPLQTYYMGPDPYDQSALAALGVTFVSCPAGKQRRYASVLNVLDLFKTGFGFIVALCKIFVIYPDVIMSKGGYTSVPVVLAAWFFNIPIVIHESDARPGKANVLAAKHARLIAVSYPDTLSTFPQSKTVLTGIPIRPELLVAPEPRGDSRPLSERDLPRLLILGGSQGAERINSLILESLDELLPRFTILHQTGTSHFDNVKRSAETLIADPSLRSRYSPVAFLNVGDLSRALHESTIVISRAGSGTIYEIAAHGKPSIIIPIPEEISHDQRSNAYAYARTGAAIVIEEENLEDSLLIAETDRIMGDPTLYASMGKAAAAFVEYHAAEKIATELITIMNEHS